MTNNSITELRQKITDSIVSRLEESVKSDYQKPWVSIQGIPQNAVTKNYYHGINTLWLSCSDFPVLEFASYKQWQAIGAQVIKGSKGLPVVFFKQLQITDKETDEQKTIPLMRHSTVFNCDQVEGYEPEVIKLNKNECIENAQSFADNCHINTIHGFDRACFIPSQNEVNMPSLDQFLDSERYYSTLFHEYTHATGHKSRLDRKLSGSFGNPAYAFEELIAELGSSFTMAYLGLEATPRKDHVAYIKSWLGALKSDNSFIFKASAKAQAACDYLITQQEERKAA